MEAYGRSALDSQIWTISVPRSTPRLYYNLDDRLGEAEHRRTPDFTKYQFDGHGLRRFRVPYTGKEVALSPVAM